MIRVTFSVRGRRAGGGGEESANDRWRKILPETLEKASAEERTNDVKKKTE